MLLFPAPRFFPDSPADGLRLRYPSRRILDSVLQFLLLESSPPVASYDWKAAERALAAEQMMVIVFGEVQIDVPLYINAVCMIRFDASSRRLSQGLRKCMKEDFDGQATDEYPQKRVKRFRNLCRRSVRLSVRTFSAALAIRWTSRGTRSTRTTRKRSPKVHFYHHRRLPPPTHTYTHKHTNIHTNRLHTCRQTNASTSGVGLEKPPAPSVGHANLARHCSE